MGAVEFDEYASSSFDDALEDACERLKSGIEFYDVVRACCRHYGVDFYELQAALSERSAKVRGNIFNRPPRRLTEAERLEKQINPPENRERANEVRRTLVRLRREKDEKMLAADAAARERYGAENCVFITEYP